MSEEDAPDRKAGHTVADHVYGIDLAHTHDGYADHDHDFPDEGALEDNPIWIADHVSLMSVGIDIGSSGTQVIFSRINLRRLGEDLSSRYFVVSRETLFQSGVALTPYRSEEHIDEAKLGAIIDDSYAAARIDPGSIDTGAVILTGEALRRENAQAIAGIIAEKGGDFVCATAGHHMESMLAAYGSGAAAVSSAERKRILNIDIGGGTTKLAVVERGKVTVTAAVHIGGRLQVVEPGADGRGRIVRLDPAGKTHARRAGFRWNRGDAVNLADLDAVAEGMADTLVSALATRPLPHDVAHLYLTDPILDFGAIDGMMFSGGVGEYVYAREDRDFGDMGRRLGRAIRRRVDAGAFPWPLLPAGECIRATALGASEYSVQLSGNTCYISMPGALLPRHNLQVLQPDYVCTDAIDPDAVAAAIRRHLVAFDVEEEREIALAFRWQGAPAYARLAGFAEGIRRALAGRMARRQPIYIMLDGDVAQTLGAIMREELEVASEILVIDGVVLMDFDYIDLGRIRLPSNTVPVTIKSLVFSEDPRGTGGPAGPGGLRGLRPVQRLHHHADEHEHDRGHEHGHGNEHGHVREHGHGHEHNHADVHHDRHDHHNHPHDHRHHPARDSGEEI
jgi:ethanolamine utilization protein EutA